MCSLKVTKVCVVKTNVGFKKMSNDKNRNRHNQKKLNIGPLIEESHKFSSIRPLS